MKYRVRVYEENGDGTTTVIYSQVADFNPIPEIVAVLNKPRRKARKDAGVGKELPKDIVMERWIGELKA